MAKLNLPPIPINPTPEEQAAFEKEVLRILEEREDELAEQLSEWSIRSALDVVAAYRSGSPNTRTRPRRNRIIKIQRRR